MLVSMAMDRHPTAPAPKLKDRLLDLRSHRAVVPTECIYVFRMILRVNSDISLNSISQLIFVMVKCCVFFAVRTDFLNII
jgi:hypothetical protein